MLFRVIKNNSSICQLLLWAMVLSDTLRIHVVKEEVNFCFEKVFYSKLNTNWRKRCNWLSEEFDNT